jgi:hypothetical protein
MDLMLSPNVPNRLRPGGHDGFPTGCCTEAALNGVAVLCTDPLGENGRDVRRFIPDEEICLIGTDRERIVQQILAYRDRPSQLYDMARRGQARCRELYSAERQLAPREALLASHSR